MEPDRYVRTCYSGQDRIRLTEINEMKGRELLILLFFHPARSAAKTSIRKETFIIGVDRLAVG
jgi:hypothetical protein